jgi:hypothetical protein
MSQDEEDAIIGRLLREQKQLEKSNAILGQEISEIGSGLKRLSDELNLVTFGKSKVLSEAEESLLDVVRLRSMLTDLDSNKKRLSQIQDTLSKL